MGLLQGETPVLSMSVCLSLQGLPCTEAPVQHIQMQVPWFAVHEPFPWVSEQFSASTSRASMGKNSDISRESH